MIGTLDEAKEIYSHFSSQQWSDDFSEFLCPEGWRYVGDGSSRIAYQGPSGAVYKVQRFSDDEYNEVEYLNFEYIRSSGMLPEGWSVPHAALFTFEALIVGFDYTTRTPQPKPGTVKIIALEYVDGDPIEYTECPERARMYECLDKVGLGDGARGNVLRVEDRYVIVDAGEGTLSDQEVYFERLAA